MRPLELGDREKTFRDIASGLSEMVVNRDDAIVRLERELAELRAERDDIAHLWAEGTKERDELRRRCAKAVDELVRLGRTAW